MKEITYTYPSFVTPWANSVEFDHHGCRHKKVDNSIAFSLEIPINKSTAVFYGLYSFIKNWIIV